MILCLIGPTSGHFHPRKREKLEIYPPRSWKDKKKRKKIKRKFRNKFIKFTNFYKDLIKMRKVAENCRKKSRERTKIKIQDRNSPV